MRNSNTELDFIAAFWALYDIKRIEKISVRELCQKAGYNRTTFYAHFDDMYDLLDKAVDVILELPKSAIPQFRDLLSLLTTGALIKPFALLFKENSRYIEMLSRNRHLYILEDKIKEIVIPALKRELTKDRLDMKLDYVIEYQLSAAFGIFRTWIKNEKNISEQEIIKLIYEISSRGVFSVISATSATGRTEADEEDLALLEKFDKSSAESTFYVKDK